MMSSSFVRPSVRSFVCSLALDACTYVCTCIKCTPPIFIISRALSLSVHSLDLYERNSAPLKNHRSSIEDLHTFAVPLRNEERIMRFNITFLHITHTHKAVLLHKKENTVLTNVRLIIYRIHIYFNVNNIFRNRTQHR